MTANAGVPSLTQPLQKPQAKNLERKTCKYARPSPITNCPQRARRKRPGFLNQNIRPGKGGNNTALRLKGNDSSACKQAAASLKGKLYLHDAPTHAACTPRPSRMFNNTRHPSGPTKLAARISLYSTLLWGSASFVRFRTAYRSFLTGGSRCEVRR
jgi:hypothetical protein